MFSQISSTSTNKQPLLVDRPLFDSVRVTTQTVGSQSSNTDYTINSTTSGDVIALSSGQVVLISDTGLMATAPQSGYGYYTYTGSTTLTGANTSLIFSGGIGSGFTYNGVVYGDQPSVTFVFYHTRGTTTPIPASGDYRILFAKEVPALNVLTVLTQCLSLQFL